MSETTRQDEPQLLFAIEVDATTSDLSENLAVYRRLSARQKATIAAELRRKVETEIAEAKRPARRRSSGHVNGAGQAFQAGSTLGALTKSLRSRLRIGSRDDRQTS